jgi:hypothetical protein
MRQKRAKAYRKLMHVYSMSFGFRQPYQVLGMSTFVPLRQLRINELVPTVDSEMCKSALGQNLNLVKQLYAVLQGEVKPSGCLLSIHKPLTSMTAKPSSSDHPVLHSRALSTRQTTAIVCRSREELRAKDVQSS